MDYPPSPEEFRAYLEKHSLSRRDVADMLNIDSRIVSYWKSGKNSSGKPMSIPFSVWFTLRTKVEGKPPTDPPQ